MMTIRSCFLILCVLFTATGCETNEAVLPAQPVAGPPLGANEIMLVDAQTQALTQQNCQGCSNAGGPAHLRLRLEGNNLAYQIAYAPLSNRPFDPDALYRVGIKIWFGGRPGHSLWLEGFDFSDARKVEGPDGLTYYFSDWYWNAAPYQNLVLEATNYPVLAFDFTRRDNLKILKLVQSKMTAGEKIVSWQMDFQFASKQGELLWTKRNLRGDAALAALRDPAAAYAKYIEPIDAAYFAELRKRKAATGHNKAYRRFVNRVLKPHTLEGVVKKANCPSLPYRLEINYHPPQTFYDEGGNAVRRAECLHNALNAYDPDRLIEAYEKHLDEETSLFSTTYDIERFSLEESLEQPRQTARNIKVALNRADYLFEGGDITAQKRARKRAAQNREAASMQALMSGLQNLERDLQHRHDLAANRVARLQAQGVRNYRAKLREQRARSDYRQTASPRRPASERQPEKVADTASAGTKSASTAAAGPMIAVYQANSRITSLPKDIPHCDQNVLPQDRSLAVKCQAVKLVTLPRLGGKNPQSCSGDEEVDILDGYEASIIGGIYRMQAVTRGELERLRAEGERQTGKMTGLFFEQDAARATSRLIEWKYAHSKAGHGYRYFLDKTELRSFVRNNDCVAVRWTKSDGSTFIERLDRVR
jgi:hypothetical protein